MASLYAKLRGKLLAFSLALVSCSSGGPDDVSHEGKTEDETSTVQQAYASSSTTTIASAAQHACKIITGGKVVCWGDNQFGKLGNGTTMAQTGAVLVSGITNATQIAASNDYTCTVLSDGTARCWGVNDRGQ